jgi:hypothetical protein
MARCSKPPPKQDDLHYAARRHGASLDGRDEVTALKPYGFRAGLLAKIVFTFSRASF